MRSCRTSIINVALVAKKLRFELAVGPEFRIGLVCAWTLAAFLGPESNANCSRYLVTQLIAHELLWFSTVRCPGNQNPSHMRSIPGYTHVCKLVCPYLLDS